MGGGRGNSCLDPRSLPAGRRAREAAGSRRKYVDKNREGDHICYISDLRKFRSHFPGWDVTIPLREILAETMDRWRSRVAQS